MAKHPLRNRRTDSRVTTFAAAELQRVLGPAEAQYEALALELRTPGGQPLACGTTIVDQDANDGSTTQNTLRVDFGWNDLAAETGYRIQIDLGSTTFVTEDQGFEVAADSTTDFGSVNLFPDTTVPWTFRVIGHVGHAPGHGATPIAGDVVSNECTVTFQTPPEEPPH